YASLAAEAKEGTVDFPRDYNGPFKGNLSQSGPGEGSILHKQNTATIYNEFL
ncbi:unnamed protein product, partial [Dovyalis caffra]